MKTETHLTLYVNIALYTWTIIFVSIVALSKKRIKEVGRATELCPFLPENFCHSKLEEQGRSIIMEVTRPLLLGPFYLVKWPITPNKSAGSVYLWTWQWPGNLGKLFLNTQFKNHRRNVDCLICQKKSTPTLNPKGEQKPLKAALNLET